MENKLFFLPGDIVLVRLNIDNKPLMVVKEKVTNRFVPNKEDAGKGYLEGIKCFYFDKNLAYHEIVVNTKDLIIIE